MPVAEIFLSAFIKVLLERLASAELLQFARVGGVVVELEKWSKHMEIIGALLDDAEEKQITQRSVLLWLKDLRDLAYDIEDVLDDLCSEVLRLKLLCPEKQYESSSRINKVWKLVPTCCASFTPSALMCHHRISSKVDEITIKLDGLAERKNYLMLIQNVKGRSYRIKKGSRTTTSLVVESRVRGREEDKAAIIRLLLEDSTSNYTDEVRVLPIVGMGGLGKTTLAQLVYNDEQVKGHFDLTVWLCVADDFDVLRMTCTIYRSVTGNSEEFKDLDHVQVSLKEKLSNKKILIVLDDVWKVNNVKWDLFCAPFSVGAPGSIIIVTTRIGGFTQCISSIEAYQLKPLDPNDCLSLIALHALSIPNFDARPDLKDVGTKIAEKCKGLPLAAKALGGLLRTKASSEQWKDVLTSNAWDLPESSNDIIPALRLSYHRLPPHLKHLFAYCSIFPKDYEFEVHELILLWMAEGFLQPSGKKQMEELGLEYFQELLSGSFFQCCGDKKSRYVMHDMMNDLAQIVAGELFFRLDEHVGNKKHSRHSSYIRHQFDTFEKLKAFEGAKYLRTFLPLSTYEVYEACYLSRMVVKRLLPKLRYLRVLSLSGYRNISKVPNSIGNLKHLRYLNFSNTRIKKVPENVCDLRYLQSLLLRACDELFMLPKNICKLLSLRHLDIAGTSSLKQMPFGFGKLTSLRTLSKIVIDGGDGLKLSELKGLRNLQGRFCIDGLQNVKNVQDVAAADLSAKQGIKELTIRWGHSQNSVDSQSDGHISQVLKLLKPHKGLASLEIVSYQGTEFPSWVRNPSFSSMVRLTLSDCRKCTSLPSLGRLASLKELFIEGMNSVKVVGTEFVGAHCPGVSAFPSLETLSFRNMVEWEKWSGHLANGDKDVKEVFPSLAKLILSGCPKLISVSLPRIQSLVELELTSCRVVVLTSVTGIGLVKSLKIRDIIMLTQLDIGVIEHLGALDYLSVRSCDDMKYLWQADVACPMLKSLTSLNVVDCRQLISLGMKLPHNLESLELDGCAILTLMPNCCKSLKKLSINNCNELQYMSHSPLKSEDQHQGLATPTQICRSKLTQGFPNIQVLEIRCCSLFTWLPTGNKLPTSLKSLSIVLCNKLKKPEEEEDNNVDTESSLDSFLICKWRWESLPKRLLLGFSRLTRLEIVNCWYVESFTERCFPPSLTYLTISGCRNLKYLCDDYLMMRTLVSLRDLTIRKCRTLESFPDGIWPPNLVSLTIGSLKKPITGWGLHRLPNSVVSLCFYGKIPEMVSFSEVGIQLRSTSLKNLSFIHAKNLESLSAGFHFTSLELLWVSSCFKLRSLPKKLLPSLSRLVIDKCPGIEESCGKGESYWPFICNIPCVEINGIYLWSGTEVPAHF